MRYLSDTDRKRLVELAQTHTSGEIAKIMGRFKSTITRNLKKLGLKAQPHRYRPNAGTIQKGEQRSPETQFKKGARQAWAEKNFKPEGHVTVLKTGYILAKDGGKWKPLTQVHPDLNQAMKALSQLNRILHERTETRPGNPIQ